MKYIYIYINQCCLNTAYAYQRQMVGVWAMCLWEQMGRPEKVNLVELGPGRGTLMADLLRVRIILLIIDFYLHLPYFILFLYESK